MLLAAAFLDALLRTCAPNIGAKTMTAVVRVESGGDPLAIHDNTIDRSFSPVNRSEAVAWAQELIALHHSVDLGLAQVNSANLSRLRYSVRDAFDPCSNVRGGATILQSDYRDAAMKFGPGQYALRRAIGAYNTGSLFGGDDYVSRVLAAAGLQAEDDFRVPDLAPIGSGAPVFAASAIPRRAVSRSPVRPVAARVTAPLAPVAVRSPAIEAPILVRVDRIDIAARTRAIAAAAGVAPAPSPGPNAPVVLHRDAAGADWPPLVDDRPIVVRPTAPPG